jgi:hypothetical protein
MTGPSVGTRPGMVNRSELPVRDYDHLPLGSLEHRIRTLEADSLATLLDHERAHGDRAPVVQVLSARLDALRSGRAEPSGGDPAAAQPEHAPAPDGGTTTAPDNQPDTNQPLRHGVAAQTPNRVTR